MAAKKRGAPVDPAKPLKNGQHECFARVRAEGKCSETEAYGQAGYSRNRNSAHKLGKRPDVAARIDWLKEQAAKKTVTTVEDIARQLDEDREFAKAHESAAAAVSATMGKAKVLGLIIHRHRVDLPPIDQMTKTQLLTLLGKLMGEEADG